MSIDIFRLGIHGDKFGFKRLSTGKTKGAGELLDNPVRQRMKKLFLKILPIVLIGAAVGSYYLFRPYRTDRDGVPENFRFARELVTLCLLYEADHGEKDFGKIVTIDDLRKYQPGCFGTYRDRLLQDQVVLFIPQTLPLNPSRIVCIVREDSRMTVLSANGSKPVYTK